MYFTKHTLAVQAGVWPLGVRKGRPEELPFGQFAVGNQDQESNAAFVSLTAQAYLTLVT